MTSMREGRNVQVRLRYRVALSWKLMLTRCGRDRQTDRQTDGQTKRRQRNKHVGHCCTTLSRNRDLLLQRIPGQGPLPEAQDGPGLTRRVTSEGPWRGASSLLAAWPGPASEQASVSSRQFADAHCLVACLFLPLAASGAAQHQGYY